MIGPIIAVLLIALVVHAYMDWDEEDEKRMNDYFNRVDKHK